MRDFTTDLRFAWRSLWKNPALTGIAVAALALGIGANTAIFSVVHGVLLSPLPYSEPERIIRLIDTNPQANLPRFPSAPPDFADWRAQNQVFSQLAAIRRASVNLTGEGDPERIVGARVSADFFPLFRVPAELGRSLLPEEDQVGGPKVAVLSHGLWQRRFGGDPKILGRRLMFDGEPTTVVGVMPESFVMPQKAELWLPLQMQINDDLRGAHFLAVAGRLKDGVSIERAQTEMTGIADRIALAHPASNKDWGVQLYSLRDLMVEDIRPALLVLLGAVGLVLLIACANVANLLLSRLAAREREVALRSALGAGRGRLIRQFLTESTLLSLLGGLLGALLAWQGTHSLIALFGDRVPRAQEIGVDGTVLGFSLALSLGCGLLFGLLPALHSSRTDLRSSLSEGGRGQAGDRRGRLTRRLLVFSEVALAIILLVGAGLLVRSLRELQQVKPGFRPAGILTAQIQLPNSPYESPESVAAFYRALLPKLAAVPGVSQAAIVSPLPLSGSRQLFAFEIEGKPIADLSNAPASNAAFVSNGYFSALSIPVVKGRTFDDRDRLGGDPVIVINQALAAKMWPNEDPIGKRLTFDVPNAPKPVWQTVIGVVGGVHNGEPSEDPGMQSYQPLAQVPPQSAGLVLRTTGDPAGLSSALTQAIRSIDPGLPISSIQTLDRMVYDSVAAPRANAILLTLLAALALVLAAVGVYGVLSYSVAQRTREIGLRMALGAGVGQVLRQILREGLGTVLAGIAAGLVGSYFVVRALESLMFGVKVRDPLTFVGVPLVLLAVALFATWVPARRATRVEPVVALRYE
ncbi:MAG TPA: ABC transporter permease [Thermoanaerobaculia bacterium]|nr:ABC transporter permease [Thermoanaerobaculia bacterium]